MNRLRRLPGGLPLLLCLLLAGAALAVYSQVSHHGFLTFDDDMYVTYNPMVRAGLTWAGVKWAFTAFHASNWHPLTWLSHMLDCQIFGVWPGGHHLTNLAWHLANTILLFLFLARVTGALWPSALVAALFALHPLHVESVAWVSERKDVLSTFFWLLALWAYAGYAAAPSLWRYLAVVLAFILGLLSKPMVVTLPFVLLLLDYWPLGRVAGGPGPAPGFTGSAESQPQAAPRSYRQLLQEKIPLFALTAISCLLTVVAQKGSGAVMPMAIRPWGPRIANALVAYVQYLVKLFWPYPMTFFYPLAPVPWWEAAGAGLALLVLTIFLLLGSRRHPYLAVGWLWYLGTMVPVIGLIQVGGQAMADRYTYVPFIGLFIIVAWGLTEAAASWHNRRIVLPASAAAILLACLLSSWGQAGYWRNSETLFTRAINLNPNNYMAYHHLGMDLANRGQLHQAIAMYQKTLALAPKYPSAYNNLAIAYARQGRFKEAIPLFKEAIKLTPGNVGFYRNLALAYSRQGKKSEAATVREHIKWLLRKK